MTCSDKLTAFNQKVFLFFSQTYLHLNLSKASLKAASCFEEASLEAKLELA